MSARSPAATESSARAAAHPWFARGQTLHQEGRLAEAADCYRQALQRDPRHEFAMHYLGVIELQSERPAAALDWIAASLRLNDRIAEMHFNAASAQRALGRFDEALGSLERALKLDSRTGDSRRGDYWAARGEVLLALNRAAAALESFDTALTSAPHDPALHTHRGLALARLQRFADALEAFDRALALQPGSAALEVNRAGALVELGRADLALSATDRALAAEPKFVPAHCHRAWALNDLQRPADALHSADRAIELDARFAPGHGNRGKALQALDRPGEALEAYAEVMALQPDNAQARVNAAHAYLSLGELAQGFELYEWRKRLSTPLGNRQFDRPVWLGEADIRGKRLLLHSEQGLGDTVQFCRYALVALERGATVLLAVQPALNALLQTLDPRIRLVSADDASLDFDYHCPLLSLPLAFRTGLDTIPARIPYLQAEASRCARWSQHLGTRGIKVGICWQGRREAKVDLGRSPPLRLFAPLATLPGVRLISLQKGAGSEQLADLPENMPVESLGETFDAGPDAFLDTAAVMHSLDLVITSDTAVAHIAGALGRPAWVALAYAPDWRWLRERADSPWYPQHRLFRQPAPGRWEPVFERLSQALRSLQASAPMS